MKRLVVVQRKFAENAKRRAMLCQHAGNASKRKGDSRESHGRHAPVSRERIVSLDTGLAAESIASSKVALKENNFKMHACGFTKECVQLDSVLSVIRPPCPPLSSGNHT
jgi:hypothetical protein